ncbi:MAG: class II fumarate hydratase [Acidobacteria bacterium]|nr:class II fumarate hydratase [Acidobacteriota bacterium]
MTDRFRIETDTLGEIRVPADAYWGASTQRAFENFPISGQRFHRRFIRALGLIKQASAEANMELGLLERGVGEAIVQAAREVAEGRWDHQFILDIYQTGSGTSTNMNANEVIANRAIEILGGRLGSKQPVHPNDHVNKGQSSNDVIPTVIHVSALEALERDLLPALAQLRHALEGKAHEFDDVLKIGRTHLQDAVPMRLGQEFSGYASMMAHGIERVEAVRPRLAELALGGTAIGTGLNTPAGFAPLVIGKLAAGSGIQYREAANRFEALSGRDAVVETSGALKTVACSLMKIGNDLRWLGSGPRCGIGEIHLPELQPGSSIMPGKVNPVIPEMACMVAAQVIGNDAAITIGGQAGNFELNVMMPMMAYNLHQSIAILSSASKILAERCITGIQANRRRCEELVEQSLAMVTALAPRIGYDRAAQIAKESHATGRTVRQIAREQHVLPDEELDRVLDPRRMTEPGIPE